MIPSCGLRLQREKRREEQAGERRRRSPVTAAALNVIYYAVRRPPDRRAGAVCLCGHMWCEVEQTALMATDAACKSRFVSLLETKNGVCYDFHFLAQSYDFGSFYLEEDNFAFFLISYILKTNLHLHFSCSTHTLEAPYLTALSDFFSNSY